MKTLKYKVAGFLQQDETGPQAQVGDQVKLFLDTVARPELPEYIFGIIQPGIKLVECDTYTVYTIEYDSEYIIRPQDILNVTTTAAVDVVAEDLNDHIEDLDNPHEVTKAQVGLGNVDNTSDADKPISTATQTALNLKAPINSPTFTGTPAAPTATAGTSTTQIATTAFVATSYAPLASPTFTGDPKAPTPSTSDNDTSIATTAFVQAQKRVVFVDNTSSSSIQASWANKHVLNFSSLVNELTLLPNSSVAFQEGDAIAITSLGGSLLIDPDSGVTIISEDVVQIPENGTGKLIRTSTVNTWIYVGSLAV